MVRQIHQLKHNILQQDAAGMQELIIRLQDNIAEQIKTHAEDELFDQNQQQSAMEAKDQQIQELTDVYESSSQRAMKDSTQKIEALSAKTHQLQLGIHNKD